LVVPNITTRSNYRSNKVIRDYLTCVRVGFKKGLINIIRFYIKGVVDGLLKVVMGKMYKKNEAVGRRRVISDQTERP
jgi:hypothetical protein